jgi:hypothetical protein
VVNHAAAFAAIFFASGEYRGNGQEQGVILAWRTRRA